MCSTYEQKVCESIHNYIEYCSRAERGGQHKVVKLKCDLKHLFHSRTEHRSNFNFRSNPLATYMKYMLLGKPSIE